MDETDAKHLLRAIELARLAREHGNHPFGSLLVGAGGKILAEHENEALAVEFPVRTVPMTTRMEIRSAIVLADFCLGAPLSGCGPPP